MNQYLNRFLLIFTLLLSLGLQIGCEPLDGDEYYDLEPLDEGETQFDDVEFIDDEQEEPAPIDSEAQESRALEIDQSNGTGSNDPDIVEDQESGSQSQEAIFEAATCPFREGDNYAVTCGWLTVPENRELSDSPDIELAIAILPAANGNASAPPVIFLDGGPGGSALSSFSSDIEGWVQYGFTQNRDLVFIDQRGTGYSQPSLNCPEMGDESLDQIEASEACHARLTAEGVDLEAYNSRENGQDVADLAQALEFDTYSLYGISYGTRLALAIMRDNPERIEKVVLDSPFPPHVDPGETETVLAYDRMRALFNTCAADQACNAAFPELEAVYLDTVFELNQNPAADGEITGDYLAEVVQQALFAGEEVNFLIPLMIYDASEGEFSLLDELAEEVAWSSDYFPALFGEPQQTQYQSDEENDGDSEGMYNSVMCHDEFSFSNFTEAETNMLNSVPEEIGEGLFITTINQFSICDIWNVEEESTDINEPVRSDIPTLILVGEFDPATPPIWGEETAQYLSNSLYFELPGSGHSVTSANFCAIALMDSFFNSADHSVDDSCLEDINPIEFELP